jgi:hypothetical protein
MQRHKRDVDVPRNAKYNPRLKSRNGAPFLHFQEYKTSDCVKRALEERNMIVEWA